jgi:hypothetical protein
MISFDNAPGNGMTADRIAVDTPEGVAMSVTPE